MRSLGAPRLLLAGVAAAVVLGGCSSTSSSGPSSTLNVSERDFHIAAPTHLRAGNVTIHDHNLGPETHELIVVRADNDHLPLRADGLTVDEDAIKRQIVGTVEDVAPEAKAGTKLHLQPGNYLMFCNMAGHFAGGMYTKLVVR
jgi:uncharacterized cupredoxin-like copper-binding protein